MPCLFSTISAISNIYIRVLRFAIFCITTCNAIAHEAIDEQMKDRQLLQLYSQINLIDLSSNSFDREHKHCKYVCIHVLESKITSLTNTIFRLVQLWTNWNSNKMRLQRTNEEKLQSINWSSLVVISVGSGPPPNHTSLSIITLCLISQLVIHNFRIKACILGLILKCSP